MALFQKYHPKKLSQTRRGILSYYCCQGYDVVGLYNDLHDLVLIMYRCFWWNYCIHCKLNNFQQYKLRSLNWAPYCCFIRSCCYYLLDLILALKQNKLLWVENICKLVYDNIQTIGLTKKLRKYRLLENEA